MGCTKSGKEGWLAGWLDEYRERKDEEVGRRDWKRRGLMTKECPYNTHMINYPQTLKATPYNVLALTLMTLSYLYPTHNMSI